MNLKKSLMMLLMIMVSHLSWSQYPLIKKLGKDEVVIMTVKQGEDINKKFSLIEASFTQHRKKEESNDQKNLNDFSDYSQKTNFKYWYFVTPFWSYIFIF